MNSYPRELLGVRRSDEQTLRLGLTGDQDIEGFDLRALPCEIGSVRPSTVSVLLGKRKNLQRGCQEILDPRMVPIRSRASVGVVSKLEDDHRRYCEALSPSIALLSLVLTEGGLSFRTAMTTFVSRRITARPDHVTGEVQALQASSGGK